MNHKLKWIVGLTSGFVGLSSACVLTTSCGSSNNLESGSSWLNWVRKHRTIHKEVKNFDYSDPNWVFSVSSPVPILNQNKKNDFLNYFSNLKNFNCKDLFLVYRAYDIESFFLDYNEYSIKIISWKKNYVESEERNLVDNFSGTKYDRFWKLELIDSRTFKVHIVVVSNTETELDGTFILNNGVFLSGSNVLILFDGSSGSTTNIFSLLMFGGVRFTEWNIEYPNLTFTTVLPD